MTQPQRLFFGKPSLSLTGFMFSGKSSVGRALARKLGLEFVDLDTQIVARAGKKIERIFREDGEAAFRAIERQVVREVLPVPGQIVAAGGGAVIDDENRGLMRRHSCVVWLKISPETVLDRLRSSRGRVRPLLKVEDPEAEIRRLLEERSRYYEQCDLAVDTDGLGVRAVARRLIAALERQSGSSRPDGISGVDPTVDTDNGHGGCECRVT
ncbi:shikimate kinase [bacterium]|nr:shikimate kinase [bacterium]